jgi:diguanylate cyclase (GGDEF)-like protein
MSHAISKSKRNGTYCAILFLDLDKFKWLNDTHGHEIGDILLCEVSKRLLHVIRESNTVARIGGDEFIVLLEDCHSDQKLAIEYTDVVVSKIQKTLGNEYILKGIYHTCSASIGMTLFMGDEQDSKQILKQADMAMYETKRKMSLAQPQGEGTRR